MKRQVLLTVVISYAMAQLMLTPIKVITVDTLLDLKARLKKAGDKLVVIGFLPRAWQHSDNTQRIEKLALQYMNIAVFLRVYEDSDDDIFKEYDVTSVPTFLFVRKSAELLSKRTSIINNIAYVIESVKKEDQQLKTDNTTDLLEGGRGLIHINSPQELEERLSSAGNKLIILAFLTKWCSKCRKVISMVETMADDYYGSVVFLKIDDDSVTNELYMKYKIKRVPMFVFIRNSKQIDPYIGTTNDKVRTHVELQDFKIFLKLCTLTKEYFGSCNF